MLYQNMIILETIDDFKEYVETSLNPELEAATKDIVEKIQNNKLGGHHHLKVSEIAETISGITGQGSLFILADMATKKEAAILKQLMRGKRVAINGAGGWFMFGEKDGYTILPKILFVEEDIKIARWKGGKHYYAKVAHNDVVDDDDNVKWDTYDQAMSAAIKYMNELNIG